MFTLVGLSEIDDGVHVARRPADLDQLAQDAMEDLDETLSEVIDRALGERLELQLDGNRPHFLRQHLLVDQRFTSSNELLLLSITPLLQVLRCLGPGVLTFVDKAELAVVDGSRVEQS